MTWLNKRIFFQLLILLLLGAFCVLGFAPFYLYPASIFSIISLCYFWLNASSIKQAAVIGFFYGLGLFGIGIYWIYISLHDYGGMPSWMATLATFMLCAFMASFNAVIGACAVWLVPKKHQQPFCFILAIAICWTLADWIRSWIFTGFPWLTMGYSQVPYSPLSGYMPILGVYGVTLLTVIIAGNLSLILFKRFNQKLHVRNSIAFILAVWISGSLFKLIEWTQPIGAPIQAALIQGNIAQDTKWSPETAQLTMQTYLNLVTQSRADLIILPETALPVLSSQLAPEIQTTLAQHAKVERANLIIGMVEYNPTTEEYFNSAISMGQSPSQTYQKNHLVPFGEFIPLKQIFGWIYRDYLNMPLSDLSRGKATQQPMQLSNQKVAVNVCYEDVFGEEIIRQLPAATLLVNISNDAWYGDSYAAAQHLQFSQARALETGRMMLRATNTGATASIDTHGLLLAQAPHFTRTILNVKAQGYSGSTPYVRFGNRLMLFSSGLGLLVLLTLRQNPFKTSKK